MQMTFKSYLEYIERQRWIEEDGYNDAIRKFTDCKADRLPWDEKAEFGAMVMANDMHFMDYLLTGKSDKNKTWGDNFVRTNISTAISHLIAADIKINLKCLNEERSKSVKTLEAELNFAIDKFNMLREDDQALWYMKFMGMAYSYTGWNKKDQDSDWFTGKPFKTAIDPRKVWIDPNTSKMNKSDCEYFFWKETYNTNDLKKRYPQIRDLIAEYEINEEYRKTLNYKLGKTDVIRYHYKRIIPIKRRAIVNETTKKVRYFLEKEYEHYLEIVSVAKGLYGDMDSLKEIGESKDETEVFPDNIMASKKLESEITAWYDVLFIENIPNPIQLPVYIGDAPAISVMSCNYDPNSAYSFGDAWREKDVLEASILMMTLQLFDTIRKYKPVAVIYPGAFLNEEDIRTKWGDPNLQIRLNAQFFEEHKQLKPRDCIWILTPPQVGNLQLALNEKLNNIAKLSENTPSVIQGEETYSGQPAKGIIALQQAASQGMGISLLEYEEFMKNSYNVLKRLIANNREYKHNLYAVKDDNTKGNIEVQEWSLYDANIESILEISVEQSSEIKKQIREQKFLRSFQLGLISQEDFIKVYLPEDSERLINNKDSSDKQKIIMKIVETNPMIQQIIAQTLNQSGMEPNVFQPNSEIKTG